MDKKFKKYKLPSEPKSWFDSYIVLYNLKGGTKTIPIVLSPTGLNENISASYDQQTSPGRSAPIISYTNTGARTLSFSIRVSVNTLPTEYGKDVTAYVSNLKALLYPDYSSSVGIIRSPHCKVVIGNLKLDGVCTSFSASYQDLYMESGEFGIADVDLSFTEVVKNAPGNVNIINKTIAQNTSNIGTAEDVEPILTLSGNGVGENNSNPYMYGKNSDVVVSATGGATHYPMGMTTLGYTCKKSSGIDYGDMTFDFNNILSILNSNDAKKNDLYYIYYHLFYNGNEVDKQKKCRKVKIS